MASPPPHPPHRASGTGTTAPPPRLTSEDPIKVGPPPPSEQAAKTPPPPHPAPQPALTINNRVAAVRPGALDLRHFADEDTSSSSPPASPHAWATARPDLALESVVGGAPLVRSPRTAGRVHLATGASADPTGAAPTATGTPRWGGGSVEGAKGGRGPLFEGISEEDEDGTPSPGEDDDDMCGA